MGYLAGDPTMGWNRLCQQPVQAYDIPGNHINIVTEPYVVEFARILQSVLDAVDGST
jgi:thioesterase domain-containing protein